MFSVTHHHLQTFSWAYLRRASVYFSVFLFILSACLFFGLVTFYRIQFSLSPLFVSTMCLLIISAMDFSIYRTQCILYNCMVVLYICNMRPPFPPSCSCGKLYAFECTCMHMKCAFDYHSISLSLCEFLLVFSSSW